MSAADAASAPLHLRLVLPAGPPPVWVARCITAWRRTPGLVLSVWQADGPPMPAAPGLAGWCLRRVPALQAATGLWLAQPPAEHAAAAVDVLLALDQRAVACLKQAGDARHRWVVCDREGTPLRPDRPLLDSVTSGQGLALQLRDLQADGRPGVLRRQAHWPAPTQYAPALDSLAPAAGELVAQALVDLRLGVRVEALETAALLVAAEAPGWAGWSLLRGRWRSWRELQCSRWLSEYWRIGVVDAPIGDWLRARGRLPVRWITRQRMSGYWADPMGMVGNARQLFCEYLDERSGQGHLELLTVDEDSRVVGRKPLPVGGGAHVSFPLVLELDGRRLGVAEAAATGECLLYEVACDGTWRPVGTLLSGTSAADPAMFAWQGRYWLAVTDLALGDDDNLCLYHAERLDGPWLPHANNPVRRDVRGARMAGGFFWADGQLYRPSQDCLAGYGAALTIHRVLRCTPDDYHEEAVARIEPDRDGPCPHGMHTVSGWGQRTLVDGKRLGINPVVLLRKLRERLGLAPRGTRAAPVPPASAAARPPATRHLAVYVPHLRLGGGETSLLRLAEGFVRAGLAVDLIVHTLHTAELPVPDGVQLITLDTDRTASAVRRLARVLRQRRPDGLLSGFPHTNVAAVAAALLARVPCRCVLTEHAPVSQQILRQGGWRYRVLPPLVRWAYRRAAGVVAVSAGVRDDLQQQLGVQAAVRVIANPVLADQQAPPAAASALHPWLADATLQVVLSLSRLSTEKDLPTLLQAFAQLHAARPTTRLLLAGDGPERVALEGLVDRLGLQAVVQLPGRVTDPMAWMRRAAVFVLASQFEGFGNVLVEALASGVPVVSTDCPVGPREILCGGRYGRLVPVGDAAAMALAMGAAIDQGTPIDGGMAHAAQFTQGRASAAYLALFDELQRGRPC